jgi:hypothetical protein
MSRSNLNCVGSGGSVCQTINGKTVCASGRGDFRASEGLPRGTKEICGSDNLPEIVFSTRGQKTVCCGFSPRSGRILTLLPSNQPIAP